MSTSDRLAQDVLAVLRRYSGRREIGLDQMISRDVGIGGGDGVQLLEELEERFGTDLDPLMQAEARYLPRRWIDRLRGRDHGPRSVDLTVRRLIDYIAANGGGGA